jgi:hypothetical protein
MSEQSRIDRAKEQRIIQINESNERLRQINQQIEDNRHALEIRKSIFVPKFNLLAEDFYQRTLDLNVPTDTRIDQMKKDWWNGEHDVIWKYAYMLDTWSTGNGWDEPRINYWTVMLEEDGRVFCGSNSDRRSKFYWENTPSGKIFAIHQEDLLEGPSSPISLKTDEGIEKALDRFANNMAQILYPDL